ncbi:putative secreted protein (Por secretion system target) [Tenacibaculum skagerrakense]|uniref:Putative secreted protein (Por secretion system target) n=1 Tax=Tenacibaculum skagerrakense TaxID=186571 RepID=A0A4R2NT17_9FLAO|nr:T9SS type A sorting domain-containing protein [Tenacibaculum skagerrakense]TCP24711.1 putative secreted protein (Por secretion system target) [Tenacibaculum skagerrakense]
MKKITLSFIFSMFFVLSFFAQEYEIESFTKTFTDSNRRNRRVTAKIYYPKQLSTTTENYPVIVFGHGFVMNYDAYENFFDTLVSKGYIVAFVTTEGSVFANHKAYSEDLAFMINEVRNEANNSSSPIFNLVGNTNALLGHSMGGGAAIVAASMVDVNTLVTFAPAKLRFNTITPATQVTEEALVFSGSADGVTKPNENHIPLYNSLGSNCKYFISITGGAHCYYAMPNGYCDFGERFSSRDVSVTRSEQQEIMFTYVIPWLDYKLKNNGASYQLFKDTLNNDSNVTYENGCNNEFNLSTEKLPESSFSVQVGPNPTKSFVNINTSDEYEVEKVEVYNQYGKLFLDSKSKQVDLSSLQRGIYLIKVYSKGKTITKKIVVE